MRITARYHERLAARRDAAALVRELGEHMGAAAADPSNLADRPCPVCRAADPDPRAVIEGPVYAFHRCRGCSLLYAPRVFRPDVTRRLVRERPVYRAYWEHMRADAEAMVGRPQYDGLVRRLLTLVPGREAAIDVGCGFGKLAAELRPHFDEVLGLELNRRTAAHGAGLFGVPIRSVRLERLDRPAGSVDLIVMNQVLEHLVELDELFAAARRLLRPGGILYVSIPHGASAGMRVLGASHRFVATHVHVNMFTSRALRRLFAETGFLLRRLGTTDAVDVSAVDLVIDRLPDRASLLAAPAWALDTAVRRAATVVRWPSRLGLGSHLEAIGERPTGDRRRARPS